MKNFYKFLAVGTMSAASIFMMGQGPPQLAHFHHVHLNATDPQAAIDFYTSKFGCEK